LHAFPCFPVKHGPLLFWRCCFSYWYLSKTLGVTSLTGTRVWYENTNARQSKREVLDPARNQLRACPLWAKSRQCSAKRHVRFTPNSDLESEIPQKAMSALPPKADMCGATRDVRFGPKADILHLDRSVVIRSLRRRWRAVRVEC
jgi:hypothetical protein